MVINSKLKLSLVVTALFFCNASLATSLEQAKRIHDRIAGVPPDAATLIIMQGQIDGGDAEAAAFTAMDHPDFYNVTLKTLVTPWTNEAQTVFADFNDYTATVIGMVRDNKDFRQILSGDILYIGSGDLGLPAYSNSNNDHYVAMEQRGVDLQADLVATTQSAVTGLPSDATAGVITSRAAAKSFFLDGTNRAMFRFTLLNHLCTDMEQIKDITRSSDRITQDVSRSPGGDSRIFFNACGGCHTGMDPMNQAMAYYDYAYDVDTDPNAENGQISYNAAGVIDPDTGSRVKKKYRINSANFKDGYVVTSDRWDNYWREGPNSVLGWDTQSLGLPSFGHGVKSMGRELANSEAFASCQVKKVFKTVCLRDPIVSDLTAFDGMVTSFKSSTYNYNLKQVFAETANYCKGN